VGNFYDGWLAAGDEIQRAFHRAPHVARDRDIPWVSTRQDARVKLMVSDETGFATMGSDVMKAEIPVGWHTGRHRHGEESLHFLHGTGFSIVNGQRFDWHQGSTLQVPYGAEHQHFNTGDEPALYISGMTFTLERWMKLARLEQLADCGPNDPAELTAFPSQKSAYYPDGARALIHLEEAPADEEFPGHNAVEASNNQHHYIKYLVQPENGFRARTVAVTAIWEEPAGTHSGRHKHLEAVVYAWAGQGMSELQGHEEAWEVGDVLHVPPCMWEHEHFNPSTDSYWQLQIKFGIRNWWQNVWPDGFGPRRIFDEQGRPIERGVIERVRDRQREL
jgi:quercetin dioxygenase-like cupin family protein